MHYYVTSRRIQFNFREARASSLIGWADNEMQKRSSNLVLAASEYSTRATQRDRINRASRRSSIIANRRHSTRAHQKANPTYHHIIKSATEEAKGCTVRRRTRTFEQLPQNISEAVRDAPRTFRHTRLAQNVLARLVSRCCARAKADALTKVPASHCDALDWLGESS